MLFKLKGNSVELCNSQEEQLNLLEIVYNNLDNYYGDHYRYYPSTSAEGWKLLFKETLSSNLNNFNYIYIINLDGLLPILFGVRINLWDEEVFGFKLSNSVVTLFGNDIKLITNTIKASMKILKERDVKALIFRCNGDDLTTIHAVGNLGFRYYENIIWPVLKTSNLRDFYIPNNVRSINDSEYKEVASIAKKYQYDRGHFFCDERFDKNAISNLYAKWVNSCKVSNTDVKVIEFNGKIAGYFVCKIDSLLKKYLGYNYGRLTSLALKGEFRGKRLGAELFRGTLNLLKKSGAEYIDSGYATKNHLSARLHSSNQFSSVYQEVTFHYWL